MTGLVHQIQSDAVATSVSVSILLRKVKLAAAKLHMEEVASWVEHELRGYDGNELPSYRKIFGHPQAWNPVRREWINLQGDESVLLRISTIAVYQSIASLEELIRQDGEVFFPFRPDTIAALNRTNGVSWGKMGIIVDQSQIINILDSVRNAVLDWAIDLEKRNIIGEGMSFNNEEKAAAQSSATIHIGNIQQFVGALGTANVVGNISLTPIDVAQALKLAEAMDRNVSHLIDDGADKAALVPAIELLTEEARKPEPDNGVVRGLLADLRNALSGAAGNVVAEGAIHVIGKMLG